MLYGSGDFLGGMATRRLQVLPVLLLADAAGLIVALAVAALSPGTVGLAGLAWGISAGLIGGFGLIIFYIGLAAGPMSVVAPVSGLVSTVLPVAVALAEGERPGIGVYAGALLCLVAIVMTSSAGDSDGGAGGAVARPGRPGRGRAIGYGVVSGAAFGLFFLLIRNAGESGEFWPVAAGRIGELAVVLIAAAVLRRGVLAARRGRPAADGGGRGGRHRRRRQHLLRGGDQDRRVRAGGGAGLALPRVHGAAGPGGARRAAALGAAGRPRARRDRHPAGHYVSAVGSDHGRSGRAALRLVQTTDQF